MRNDEILHKWINGELSEEELKAFRERPEYEELTQLYKATEELISPELDEEKMLKNVLSSKKKQPPPAKQVRLFPTWMKAGIAACILFLAGWCFWPSTKKAELIQYELAKGERFNGVLPDESTFVMNAETILSFDERTWSEQREVNLQGEAFFNVKKGSDFKVVTPVGYVQVLGTQFNVWSRENELEVRCKTGKVALYNSKGEILAEILPQQAARFTKGGATTTWGYSPTDQENWVDGISSYTRVPLQRVLNELERQFEIEFIYEKLDTAELVSGSFPNQNLEQALRTSLKPVGIKYDIKVNEQKVLLKQY